MDKEVRFGQILESVKRNARENGNYITDEALSEAFTEIELDDDRLKMVKDYLATQKIKVGGEAPEEEEFTPEDMNFLQMYLDELELLPEYSDGEKKAYTIQAMAGEKEAQSKLTEMYLKDVVQISKIYNNQGVLIEDLIGEGNVALAAAVTMLDSQEKPEGESAEDSEAEDDKEPRTIYYVTDEQQQSQYINMFKAQKMEAFIMNHNIDVPFMQQLEGKNEGIRFLRIDADLTDAFKAKTSKKAAKELEEKEKGLSEKIKKALKNDKLTVKLEKLKDKKVSSMLTVSEESRRMAEMMKMYAMNGMSMGDFGNEGQTLILNANHPLVQYVLENEEGTNTRMICEQLYDLARIQNAPLEGEAMAKFVQRSNDIMMLLAK